MLNYEVVGIFEPAKPKLPFPLKTIGASYVLVNKRFDNAKRMHISDNYCFVFQPIGWR